MSPKLLVLLTALSVFSCAMRAQDVVELLDFVPNAAGTTPGEACFLETTGYPGSAAVQKVCLIAPASIASDFKLTLPNALPGSTLCLQVDTGGLMTYAACSGGASFYQTMEDNGVAETQRPVLNFVSASLVLTDDAGGNETDFTLTSSPTNAATLVGTGRLINTTSPITGGGDLSLDRTIACTTCITSGTQTISGAKTFPNTTTFNTGTNMTSIAMTSLIEMSGTGLDYSIDRSSAEGLIFGRIGGDDIVEIEEISTVLNEVRLQTGSGASDDIRIRLVTDTAGDGFNFLFDRSVDILFFQNHAGSNFFSMDDAGTPEVLFEVNLTVASGDQIRSLGSETIRSAGGFQDGVNTGIDLTCSGGDSIINAQVSGGIIVAGSCAP